jgi:S1-C subfamily serine protease
MVERQWYVRVRGRVIGPFNLQQLKSLRDRGQFRRFHEVSGDRKAWRPASSISDVFPSEAADSEGYELQPAEPSDVASDRPVSSISPAVWYYAGSGDKAAGPVALDRLSRLLHEGSITPSTLVWKEGMPNWVALATLDIAAAPSVPKSEKRTNRRKWLVSYVLLFGLVVAATGLGGYVLLRNKGAIPDIAGRDEDLSSALGLVVCGVKATLVDGSQVEEANHIGSCFAITPEGHFLTNKHVVEKVWNLMHAELLLEKIRKEKLLVLHPAVWVFLKKKKYPADILYVSDNYDFCVLKIAHPGPFFKLTGAAEIVRGKPVAACGFPAIAMTPLSEDELFEEIRRKKRTTNRVEDQFKLRDFEFVMTNGSVSRVFSEQNGDRWIQHSATINAGSSGGPLILEDGTVIGINTLRTQVGATYFSLMIPQLREEVDRVVPNIVWK